MEIVSLHPIDPEVVQRFVAHLKGGPPDPAWVGWSPEALRDDVDRAGAGDEMAANRITRGLAIALGQTGPFFTHRTFGLSFWEAQVDRPIGMLMRPPARLFMDAGLDAGIARTMPIRLDFQHGMMGGAYVPARLIDQAYQLLEDHMERSVKRLVVAEYDPMATLGLTWEAMAYARERGMGLYEALDVVGPDGQGLPGMSTYSPDRARLDGALVARITEYQKPPKKPGLLQRMFGRGGANASSNGHIPEGDG